MTRAAYIHFLLKTNWQNKYDSYSLHTFSVVNRLLRQKTMTRAAYTLSVEEKNRQKTMTRAAYTLCIKENIAAAKDFDSCSLHTFC